MPTETIHGEVPEHQQHLLAHWDSLSDQQRASLATQIRNIDFDLISELFEGDEDSTDWNEVASRAEPPPAFRLNSSTNRFTSGQAIEAGQRALADAQLGVILVAGGQGSRLGFEHPKGMFPIGPLSGRTLLQMHIEQLRAVAERYGVSIPLYLMTSPVTHDETIDFLDSNELFGLSRADLHVFCQGTMPAVDAQSGQLLLAAQDRIFLSPDGHGGTLKALHQHGYIDDMQQRKLKHLFYLQVDNPVVEICQPEFLGYHLLAESELSTQVVAKRDPLEKVGNVVSVDGEMRIIEYSDLPETHARRVNEQGELLFWAGNIAVHVFSLQFLACKTNDDALPFHRARKVVPFFSSDGKLVAPETANAIKFEKFIFDLMPLARNPIVVEADESEVFAPLKNANDAGKDCPDTVRQAICEKHQRMLESAGVRVQPGVRVEINPLFALDRGELKSKLSEGMLVDSDRYFAA